jgi:hypothetical protein
MRRGVLDRLLAAGADPAWDAELAVRAEQLTAPRRRRALAESFARAVRAAHRPSRWTCAAPLARAAVRATSPELRALATGLAQEDAPPAQAIALADQLVRDPASPLYAPGDERALSDSVRLVLLVLERSQHVELGGAPGRDDRGEHAGDHRDDREHHQLPPGHLEADPFVRERVRHERSQEHPEG